MKYEGHTKGPWYWYGNTKNRQVHLVTAHSGMLYVMSFGRWGMRGAKPFFLDDKVCIIRPVEEFVKPDHNHEFTEIDHPDAKLLKDAPALLGLCRKQHEILKALKVPPDKMELDMEFLPKVLEATEEYEKLVEA